MKPLHLLIIPAAVIVLSSCGAGKKLEAANLENAGLQANIAQLNSKIATYENDITKLKEENIAYGKEAQDCREVKEAIQKNLTDMNNAMAANGTSLKEVEAKAEAALVKFLDAGADVSIKDGLVRISLNDKLLFKSGSAVMSKEGTEALSVVADVLNEYPKMKTYVIGNTDDVNITKGFKDNWSLSTERANSIVRILRDKYKVDPTRLVAAGMGKYNPVADNATAEGKALNRRTDIVLNPDLSRLWEVQGNQ